MVSCESFCTILAPTHHCLGCQSYVALNAQIILGAFLTFSTMRGTTINQAHPVIHAGDYLLFSVRIPWIHATENVHNLFSTILPPPKIPHTHNCSMTKPNTFFPAWLSPRSLQFHCSNHRQNYHRWHSNCRNNYSGASPDDAIIPATNYKMASR